jgi:uncharacterized membrane protein
MYPAYKMVLVSGIAFLLVCLGFLIYRYIYPKKKINLFYLLLTLSLLPVISIFRYGDYESGDFNIHVYRGIEFYYLLSQGNFMPSWAGDLNATYGYPLFIFLNPLPYYLQALLHFVGFSFISSLKILLAVGYVFSGIFFYLWAKKEVKNTFAAFAGAIVYLFTPYHFVDLHFRTTIGEVTIFTFLALFFYVFSHFREKRTFSWFILSALAFSLLLFTHQAMAIFSLFIIIPYFIFSAFQSKNVINTLFIFFSIIGLGFVYASSAWFPHVVYPQYTLANVLTSGSIVFPTFQELLFSPWRYGLLFQGPNGELSYLIGYTQLIILCAGLFFVFRKSKPAELFKPLDFWLALSFLLIFMMTPLSSFVWQSVPILNTAQFSTRLLVILTFTLSMVMIYLTLYLKKRVFILSCFLFITIAYTILNWGQRTVIPSITDEVLIANLSKSTSEGEGFCCMGEPKWTLPNRRWESVTPKSHIEILTGKGEIKQISRSNTVHSYVSTSQEPLTVKENTWYFPGWNLFIDDKPAKLDYLIGKYAGIMSFTIPKGIHKVEVIYKDLPDLKTAKIITVTSVVFSLWLLLFLSLRKKVRD